MAQINIYLFFDIHRISIIRSDFVQNLFCCVEILWNYYSCVDNIVEKFVVYDCFIHCFYLGVLVQIIVQRFGKFGVRFVLHINIYINGFVGSLCRVFCRKAHQYEKYYRVQKYRSFVCPCDFKIIFKDSHTLYLS